MTPYIRPVITDYGSLADLTEAHNVSGQEDGLGKSVGSSAPIVPGGLGGMVGGGAVLGGSGGDSGPAPTTTTTTTAPTLPRTL
jgi:hypothetical protein